MSNLKLLKTKNFKSLKKKAK